MFVLFVMAVPMNVSATPPIADPGEVAFGFENAWIRFDASGSYDPDRDPIL